MPQHKSVVRIFTSKASATLLLLTVATAAQTKQTAHSGDPSFAITSVKPYTGGPQPFSVSFDGGRAEMRRITVVDMLSFGYSLTTDEQIVNLPDWAKKDRWDIKAP